jgi:integrase
MRQVEKIVLRNVKEDRDVVGYLRVLRKLCECWVLRQDSDAPLPRAAVLLHDLWNPHSRDLPSALRLYREWGAWLEVALTEERSAGRRKATPLRMNSVVPVITSAILYGGLWSEASLVALVRAIATLPACTLASENIFYCGLSLTLPNCSVDEFRAWLPDPLTATILMRTPAAAVEALLRSDPTNAKGKLSDELIVRRLATEFARFAEQHQTNKVPTGLRALVRVAESVGYTQMPSIIAAYASRRFVSHSLSLEQLQRISGEVWQYRPPVVRAAAKQPVEVNNHPENSKDFVWPNWIALLEECLADKTAADVRNGLRTTFAGSDSLVSRVADFAARTVHLRTLRTARRSLEAFRERILVLSRETFLTWNDLDPATLSGEQIELGLKITVQRFDGSHKSEAARRRLRSVLREFHTYLRDCLGKPELVDRTLLASVPPGDRPDVNVLTFREYREVLLRIDSRWPGRKNQVKRQVATSLMVLGFRGGLRREEARLLKIRDLRLDQTEEVLVRPSAGHTVKSFCSRRRVPIGLSAERVEIDVLERFLKFRLGTKGIKPTDFIFATGGAASGPISSKIFQQLNDIIADVTGTRNTEHPAHYHHCRASLASWGIMRFLLPDGSKAPGVLASVEADWLRTSETFRPELIRKRNGPSRIDAFQIGAFLGHQHPRTTMARYFRFGGELLCVYLDRSAIMHPARGLVETVSGGGTSEMQNHPPARPFVTAFTLLQERAEFIGFQSRRDTKADSQQQDPNPPDAWWRRAWELLSHVETTAGSIETAAVKVRMDISEARSIVDRAAYLATLRSPNGASRHRFEDLHPSWLGSDPTPTSVVPRSTDHRLDLQVISMYSGRVAQLHQNPVHPSVLEKGLVAYVHAVWRNQHVAVFHHPDSDGEAARSYLDLLNVLEIQQQHRAFFKFNTAKRSRWIPKWRTELNLADRVNFKPMKAPYASAAKSWIAIEPQFDPAGRGRNGGGAYGFRFLLVMAYIVFGPIAGSG